MNHCIRIHINLELTVYVFTNKTSKYLRRVNFCRALIKEERCGPRPEAVPLAGKKSKDGDFRLSSIISVTFLVYFLKHYKNGVLPF